MPDLPRKTLKVFGGIPGDTGKESDNTGIFGSRQANLGSQSDISDDIEFIQNQDGGDRWEKGWNEATIGFNRLPPGEEMEGIHRVVSYSAAYLLQKGVPEYDDGTSYFTGDIVRNNTGTGLDLYASRVDSNFNNALPPKGFSNSNWKFLDDLDNPVGSFIEDVDFTTDTTFPIPTDMTERGYIDVMVIGGGSGGNNTTIGVAGFGGSSAFGSLAIVGPTTAPDFQTNFRRIRSGSVGTEGDINIQGGSAGSGFFQDGGSGNNQGRSITLGGKSGSSIFSGSTQFGAVLDGALSIATDPPPSGFVPYGSGAIVIDMTEQTDTIGGTGAGTSIKRVSFQDLTSIKMRPSSGAGPTTDLTDPSRFNFLTTTFTNGQLKTEVLSGAQITTILSTANGIMDILANEIGFSSIFSGSERLNFSTAPKNDLAGIVSVINTEVSGAPSLLHVTASEDGGALVLELISNNTNITVSVGAGGTSLGNIGVNILNGTQGIVKIRRFR